MEIISKLKQIFHTTQWNLETKNCLTPNTFQFKKIILLPDYLNLFDVVSFSYSLLHLIFLIHLMHSVRNSQKRLLCLLMHKFAF